MGKVLGAVALALTSSVFYVTGRIAALQSMAMMGLAPLNLLPWFVVYLVADVMVLSALAMALGAACDSPHDAQQLAVLLLAPVMLPLFLLLPVVQAPNGPIATVASLFPPFTPILMMLRQAMPGGVPAWQPWAGLAGVWFGRSRFPGQPRASSGSSSSCRANCRNSLSSCAGR